jgi:glycosyltransferase involved in cell wall biosynthesis
VSYGDAIGNEMIEIRNILRNWGHDSDIYAQYIHPKVLDVKNYFEYKKICSPENILIIHFSIGYGSDLLDFVRSLPDKKILIYHNITPSEFFQDINSEYEYHTKLGRNELHVFKDIVDLALGDSEFNRMELVQLGFQKTGVLPIIIDFDKYYVADDKAPISKLKDNYINILFVGRVSPNKKFEDIIKCFYYYKNYINANSRLFLVGSYDGMDKYYSKLKDLINKLNLKDVYFSGHISFEELISYFKLADVFVTMSEHEGFCVPLLESMFFEVPIVAYNSTAIPDTLGDSGILVQEKNYEEIAEMINLVIEDKELKNKIVKRQTERLKDFRKDKIENILKIYLDQTYKKKLDMLNIRIEGTFEDSYSLSIVNRELALALDKLGHNVSLYATTGSGDYIPLAQSIKDERVKALWSNMMPNPEYAIRNIYPPRVKDLKGRYKLINFYWEESLIPDKWIADFNTLDGIISPTRFVKNVLEDSGVRCRIEVIPPGVDIDTFKSDMPPMKLETNKKFAFLNIGSGFPRKGIDVLIKAFTEEFSKQENVCLVLKTFPNIHNRVADYIKNAEKDDCPEIIHIDRDLSSKEVVALYKCGNCFVSPTRGEGFGLPMAEAMVCKIPVIATNHGGHLDFCNEKNSYLVNCKLVPSKSHLQSEYKIASSMWADPDVRHLKQLMRHVYENRSNDEIKRKVDNAYNNIITNFNWKVTAEKTVRFLEKIGSNIKVGVVSTWNTRCGIAEYTRYLLEPLSRRSKFTVFANRINPNELIHSDERNVIRCWSMDSDDLNDLYGEIKREMLDVVHIQYNFGFFKLKAMFKLIKKLKEDDIRTIVTFHSTLAFQDTVGKQIKQYEIKNGLKSIDQVWVHTDRDVRNLSIQGISENVVLIPHGLKMFQERKKCLVRGEMEEILARPNIIATFGFFLPQKGIRELIRSLPLLKEKYPDILVLALCSLYPAPISKEYFDSCKKEVEELDLKKNVAFFTDFLDDEVIIELLHASDIIVMPYQETKESASGAARIALASCRPVIVTDNRIFDEFSSCVHRIPECSPEAIAKGINDLYEDEALQERLVAAARKLIQENCWTNISEKYEDLIIEICTPTADSPRSYT